MRIWDNLLQFWRHLLYMIAADTHNIYNEGGKRALIENVNATLPYMDADMRELAKRTLSKVDALTEAEFAELPIYAADEV